MSSIERIEAAREAHLASGERLAQTLGHGFRLVILAIAIALTVRTLLFQPFSIPSQSMNPLLEAGDFLFVDKSAYGWSRASLPFSLSHDGILQNGPREVERLMGRIPEAGDVIVFAGPVRPSPDYVKRVIARGGDRVALENGRVVLNGLPLPCVSESPHLCREQLPNGTSYLVFKDSDGPLANTREILIPPGYIFVLGDNRGDSIDSRVDQTMGGIGLVHENHVIGRVMRIFFSLSPQGNLTDLIRWERIGLAIE